MFSMIGLGHALEERRFKTHNGHFVEFKERTISYAHGIRTSGGFCLVSRHFIMFCFSLLVC